MKHETHSQPLTRRQFLARNAIGFSGMLLAPSLFSWFSKLAQAEGDTQPMIPLLVFDLAGGAALPGNFLVGKQDGPEDFLTTYGLLGWDPRASSALDDQFGLPMAGNGVSKILAGLLQSMSPEARAKLRFGSLLHFSQDDTSRNALSILTLASKAGLVGSIYSNGLGQMSTNSGGNSEIVLQNLALKPMRILSVQDLLDSLGFGPALETLPETKKQALATTLTGLSRSQAERFTRTDIREQLIQLIGSSYGSISRSLSLARDVDPRLNSEMKAIYEINPSSEGASRDVVLASIVMSVLKGYSGPGVITIGGCDYHDGTQTSGDNKDNEIGREIGRAVEAAHRLQKPLFIQIITDGGIYSREGTRVWTGDAGDKSMSVVGFFHPNDPPSYRNPSSSRQIGSYTDGQGVNRGSLIGANPALAAYAAFANYLQVNGRLGDFSNLAPNIFSARELESVLIFG